MHKSNYQAAIFAHMAIHAWATTLMTSMRFTSPNAPPPPLNNNIKLQWILIWSCSSFVSKLTQDQSKTSLANWWCLTYRDLCLDSIMDFCNIHDSMNMVKWWPQFIHNLFTEFLTFHSYHSCEDFSYEQLPFVVWPYENVKCMLWKPFKDDCPFKLIFIWFMVKGESM